MTPNQGGEGGFVLVVHKGVQKLPIRPRRSVLQNGFAKALHEPVCIQGRHQIHSCRQSPLI